MYIFYNSEIPITAEKNTRLWDNEFVTVKWSDKTVGKKKEFGLSAE